jgi:hypothetical protein
LVKLHPLPNQSGYIVNDRAVAGERHLDPQAGYSFQRLLV